MTPLSKSMGANMQPEWRLSTGRSLLPMRMWAYTMWGPLSFKMVTTRRVLMELGLSWFKTSCCWSTSSMTPMCSSFSF